MNTDMILFALVCAVLAALSILAMLAPMWRSRADRVGEDTDIGIYRDQLEEVERDLARGVLDPTEAERTRVEVSRRLLTADASARATASDAPRDLSRSIAGLTGVAVIAGSVALYVNIGAPGYGDVVRENRIRFGEDRRANRPLQAAAEAANPETDAIATAPPEVAEILIALRAVLLERPRDIQGWTYLAQTEASIGNMQRAARAQEQVIDLRGDQVSVNDYVYLLDFMVIAALGYVSPEAEEIALRILQEDASNAAGLYYAGLMYAQNDRPDRAFALWRRVIEENDDSNLYWSLTSTQIEDVAAQLGMDYVLPDRRGPSDEDIEAAQDMAPEDRQAMIEGMVGQLATRLGTEGGPPQDWARLISALTVLGEDDQARAILAESELIFGGDVQAVTLIRRAAEQAGLIE